SDLVGEVSVALEDIVRINTDNPVYVTLTDGRTVSGTLSAEGDRLELKPGASNQVALNRATVVVIRSAAEQQAYERSLRPGLLEGWSGGADVGVALTRGDSDTTNLALGLGLARETRRDKTTIYGASIYERETTDGVSHTVSSSIRFGVRYERDFRPKWFGYG